MGDTTYEYHQGDTPHFKEPTCPKKPSTRACQVCESKDTETVHETGGGSIIGSWHEIEVLCRACGKYSAEIMEYDS